MPDSYVPFEKQPRLSYADASGMVIVVTCTWCKITHNYLPNDMRKLLGNVVIRSLPRYFRCERCKRKDYLKAHSLLPYGAEKQSMVVRRLVSIQIRELPVWKDGKL